MLYLNAAGTSFSQPAKNGAARTKAGRTVKMGMWRM